MMPDPTSRAIRRMQWLGTGAILLAAALSLHTSYRVDTAQEARTLVSNHIDSVSESIGTRALTVVSSLEDHVKRVGTDASRADSLAQHIAEVTGKGAVDSRAAARASKAVLSKVDSTRSDVDTLKLMLRKLVKIKR